MCRRNLVFSIVALTFLLGFDSAQATLNFPTGLTASNRGQILSILGYGTAVKVLDDPYPLGGYSGVEVGLTQESIQTDQIAGLGNKSTLQSQINYNLLTIGKGIYNNLDTFVQFAFLGQQENFSHFGGQARWSFYQAEYLPIYTSLLVHGSSTNFGNLVTTSTLGLDIILGVHEGDLTLYFGGGLLRGSGIFTGGTGGVTDSGNTEQNGVIDNRFLAGLNIKIQKAFVAFELDRAYLPTYALKLGVRF